MIHVIARAYLVGPTRSASAVHRGRARKLADTQAVCRQAVCRQAGRQAAQAGRLAG